MTFFGPLNNEDLMTTKQVLKSQDELDMMYKTSKEYINPYKFVPALDEAQLEKNLKFNI